MFSLPSSGRDLLLSVGVERITLWADWCQPSGHSIVWERGLKELLSADIRESLRRVGETMLERCGVGMSSQGGAFSGCHAIAAMLLPTSREIGRGVTGCGTVAVLSACAVSATLTGIETDPDITVAENDVCSLWVHVIDIVADSNGGGYHSVRGRYLVEAGLAPQTCGWAVASSTPTTAIPETLYPQIHLPKNNGGTTKEFYVSWQSTDSLLYVANCDLTKVLDSELKQAGDTTLLPRCAQCTDVRADRVLSVNVIDSLLLRDGVSIVLNGNTASHL